MFSLRIVTTSHYLSVPVPGLDTTHSEFTGSAVKRVPVLRIFGSTPSGQKACMHVHGVFPYLYVPYDGTQPTDRYLRQFAASLDKALNVASRSASSSFQHVYKISLVSGIPMYGYHPKEEQFLKIYLYNPNSVRKVADLLIGGAVMNKPFQPHESHIPYPLQLFMDYNLYGMNFVNVAALKFRKKTKAENETESVKDVDNVKKGGRDEGSTSLHLSDSTTSSSSILPSDGIWHEENIPSELWLPESVQRQSTCELEVDVVAADITNKQELANNIGANPGLAALWEDEKQRRREAGESSQIESDESQERQGVVPSESEKELMRRFYNIVQQQQTFRDSQSEDSTQPSLLASQLERHISREDSMTSSQGTVILDGSSDAEEDVEHPPIISMDSIKKVVSFSQSFSQKSSQGASDTQDISVTNILASLLEESGPPSSQLGALEEKDSILNQSIILDVDEEEKEDEETVVMSQAVGREENENLDASAGEGTSCVKYDMAGLQDSWNSGDEEDIVMNTDDDEDDVDLLPQFDGASDKVKGSRKKSEKNQAPAAGPPCPDTGSLSSSEDPPQEQIPGADTNMACGSDMAWRSVGAGRGMGNPQPFSPGGSGSWPRQGWPQHPDGWQGQCSGWMQNQYQGWSQQHQSSPAAYSPQQVPFRSPSSTSSFQSPTHNPYASPTHQQQQAFQSPSPSTSQHQYQFSPFHSGSSNPQFPQAYQSPSHNPYQSPASGQSFQSPQPYQSPPSNQAYQSPSASQSYQSPPTTTNQAYPTPVSSKSYQSPTGSQPYPLPSTTQPYQSPNASQSYQSPPANPYHSPSGHMYPSPYQSPSHSSSQQPYPPPYQSPSHGGRFPSQTNWGTQGYPGYYPGQIGGQGGLGKHASGSVQSQTAQSQSTMPYTQPAISSASLNTSGSPSCQSGGLSSSQSLPYQPSPTGSQQKPPQGSTSPPPQSSNTQTLPSQDTVVSQAIGPQSYPNRTSSFAGDLKNSDGFKSPHPPITSPGIATGSKNQYDNSNKLGSTSSSDVASPSSSSACMAQSKSREQGIKSPQIIGPESKSPLNFTERQPSDSHNTSTKISTLDFKPNISSELGASKEAPSAKSSKISNLKMDNLKEEKVELNTATPMIQQLLMEESPARMNIRQEDRDAAMKKPMMSPTPPKAKKKKNKANQGSKTTGRPRSTSLSSPGPPVMGYPGYGPHPMMNPQMMGRPGRSQSISLPFNSDSRMPVPMQNYNWLQQQQQQQWKQQQHYPQAGQWQQQQQSQIGGNQWQNFNPPAGGSSTSSSNDPSMSGRLQHRSFSADAVQSPFYSNNMQNRMTPFQVGQNPTQNNVESNQAATSGQNCPGGQVTGDKSSLSSLFQLVSDVGSGSEEASWDNTATSVVPNLFPNSNDSETTKSTPTSDPNLGSPTVKDFITLETPLKQGYDKANSDTAGMTSSEESDRMETDVTDMKHNTLIRSHSMGSGHPRLGKQNRMRKMGLIHNRSIDFITYDSSSGPNPAYTYTFHVPTPVFKKLKFFRSAEARKHNIKVVRMHPMDARRYSLLKIGREIVKATKLTEADLARYNVTMPPPSHFVSADGSTNRVNLDIPTVSTDKLSGDSGSEESGLSKFDTDFPPNKVAPPSSFHASQVSASMARANSSANRSSPGSVDWMRQYQGQQPANFNGGYSPGSQQAGYSPQQSTYSSQQGNFPYPQQAGDRSYNTYPMHQAVPTGNMNRHFGSQPPDCNPLGFQQYNQKGNPSQSPSTSTHPSGYYPNQQGTYMSPHQQQQQYYQQQQQYQQQQYHQLQQQQQFQQHQPPTGYNGSHMEPKNGLRSPGQHGLASRIDSGVVHGHSGDEECEYNIKGTTGTPPINTRVNAGRWDNHAEQLANTTAVHDMGDDVNTHQSTFNHSQAYGNGHGSDDNYLSIQNRQGACLENDSQLLNEEYRTKRKKNRRSLSLKKRDLSSPQWSCNGKAGFKTSTGGNSSDYSTESMHCGISDSDSPVQYTSLKEPNQGSNLTIHLTRMKGNVSSKKNIKSLRLKIPRPPSNVSSMSRGKHVCDDGESISSSQKESSDEDEGRYNSSGGRSHDLEEELGTKARGRQGTRQAKLRSLYANKPRSRKRKKQQKKQKKKQEPLKEGVHYIVIGKFKGHQAMFVKVKKVKIDIPELVSAKEYEKLAEQDIVRKVSPERYQYVYNNGSWCHDDVNSDKDDVGKTGKSTSRISQRYNNEQFRKFRKFKSAKTLLDCQAQSDKLKASVSKIESQPKNLQAGPYSGASKNLSQRCSAEDDFFCKFQKCFIKQYKAKAVAPTPEIQIRGNSFFGGVKKSKFQRFQKKFVENLNKSKASEYSSSSDDEDDYLEETILKGKLYSDRMVEVCEEESFMAFSRPTNALKATDDPGLSVRHSAPMSSSVPGYYVDSKDANENESPQAEYTDPDSPLTSKGKEELDLQITEGITNQQKEKNEFVPLSEASVDSLDSFRYEQVSFVDAKEIEAGHGSEPEHPQNDQFETISPSIVKGKGDGREDFLKRQMAFFEDISSDSDSNDTVIVDIQVEKENLSSQAPAAFSSLPSYTTNKADKSVPCPNALNAALLATSYKFEGPLNTGMSGPTVLTAYSPNEQVRVGAAPSVKPPDFEDTSCSIDQNIICKTSSIHEGLSQSENMKTWPHDGSIQSNLHSELDDQSTINMEVPHSETENPGGKLGKGLGSESPDHIDDSVEEPDCEASVEQRDPNSSCRTSPCREETSLMQTGEGDETEKPSLKKTAGGGSKAKKSSKSKSVKKRGLIYEDIATESDTCTKSEKEEAPSLTEDQSLHRLSDSTDRKCSEVRKEDQTGSDGNLDTSLSNTDTKQRQRKNGNSLKKCSRNRGRKQVSMKEMEDDNSSSNEEAEEDSVRPTKRLRQRKQTKYNFYPDEIDTSEDEWNDFSDEEFLANPSTTNSSSYRKSLKTGTKKQLGSNSTHRKKLGLDRSKPAKGSQKTRGKKKPAGGTKLLNSLSLLHMATLANLTEAQVDALNNQTGVESAHVPDRDENSFQYTERSNNDHNTTYSPSLENMSFISPQTSEEVEVSPPVAFSPTAKKIKKMPDTASHLDRGGPASRRLFSPQRRANVKPGCNGASNLGSRPLPFSRLVNNTSASSSPVPSNFLFNHSSDSFPQAEPPIPNEDASTPNTLHLLETRRAQVNCASFSMKDILRLATPDDSMDSDSKDSAALIKPPEPKRAQVKSTTLSMSDVLKLTSVSKGDDVESTEVSLDLFSHAKSYPSEPAETTQGSDSLLSQLANFEKLGSLVPLESKESSVLSAPLDSSQSTLETPPETTEASSSLLSQIANFNKHDPWPQEKVTEEKAQDKTEMSESSNKDQHFDPNQVKETMMKKGPSFEPLPQKSCGTDNREKKDLVKNIPASPISSADSCDEDNSEMNCNSPEPEANHSQDKRVKGSKSLFTGHSDGEVKKSGTQHSQSGAISDIVKSSQPSSGVIHDTPDHKQPLSPSPVERHQAARLNLPKKNYMESSGQEVKLNAERSRSPLFCHPKKVEMMRYTSSQAENNDTVESQSTIPETPGSSNIQDIPRISITYDESSPSNRADSSAKNDQPNHDYMKQDSPFGALKKDIHPLHPLQIPPYPYLGQKAGRQNYENISNPYSIYSFPYCWQWPGADANSSPLNLCTTRKSPNNYSPITPTSPISPNYLTQSSTNHPSDLSSAVKKAKPLWYPWLTVDSARDRDDPKSHGQDLRDPHRNEPKLDPRNLKAQGKIPNVHVRMEPCLKPVAVDSNRSETGSAVSNKERNGTVMTSENWKNSPHRIRDLLSSPLGKSHSLKIDKSALSHCKTVSQFLGTVIETAYERDKSKSFPDSSGKAIGGAPTKAFEKTYNLPSESQGSKRSVENTGSSHWSGGDSDGISHPLSVQQNRYKGPKIVEKSLTSVNQMPKAKESHGQNSSLASPRTAEDDRIREMIENERKLRGQYGLSAAEAFVSNNTENNPGRLSLTDRLVTKLIKGDSHEYHIREPSDASRGRKRAHSSRKGNNSHLNDPEASGGVLKGKSGRDSNDENKDEDRKRDSKDKSKEMKLSQSRGKDVTLRPVKPPPSRESIEGSLLTLELHSVQAPAAFCSNLQDLPDRPICVSSHVSPLAST